MIELTARAWRALNLSCLSRFFSAISDASSDAASFVFSSVWTTVCGAAWGGVPSISSLAVLSRATSSAGLSEGSITLRLFEGGMLNGSGQSLGYEDRLVYGMLPYNVRRDTGVDFDVDVDVDVEVKRVR